MVAKTGVDLACVPLKAIILADSITAMFEPITPKCPEVVLQLVNNSNTAPLIDHTLAWLEYAHVEEVFVLCCSDSKQIIINYLDKSKWVNKPNFAVTTIECITAGGGLCLLNERNVVQGDFILVSGDIVTNMILTQALEEHKERKQKHNNAAVMTMVIKQSEPCQVTRDGLIMGIDPTTKELLYYEDKTDEPKFNNSFLNVNPCFTWHNDKKDCYIDICSPQVLSLFTDINVDHQHVRRDFVKGLLVDEEITGFKVFTHEIHASCCAEFSINNPTDTESDVRESNTKSADQIFEKRVERIFLRALHATDKGFRTLSYFRSLYFNTGYGNYAAVFFSLMMKLALDNSNKSGNDLVKEAYDVISNWGRLVKQFSRDVNDQIKVILKFEEICLESTKEYAPLFVQVLYILYYKNKIQEDAILKWANDKEHADESDKVFVKQSEKFILWLKDASQENYREFQETDLKRLNEGGVQVNERRPMKPDLKRLNEGGVQVNERQPMKPDLKRLNENGLQVKRKVVKLKVSPPSLRLSVQVPTGT